MREHTLLNKVKICDDTCYIVSIDSIRIPVSQNISLNQFYRNCFQNND